MAVLAYTSAFSALVWMSNCTCRLLKINFGILKDTAFISSKSRVNPCWHGWDISVPKSADGRTDRQTAFQLYIVETSKCTCPIVQVHAWSYLPILLHLLSLLSLLYLPSFCLASLQHLFSVLANGYSYLVF